MKLTLDSASSSITLRTRASGLLARFAHDLEIVAHRVTGEVDLDGDAWKADLTFEVAQIRVAGVVKDGHLDTSVLSPGDRDEIERRMRDDAFPRMSRVTMTAAGSSRSRGEATFTLRKSTRAPITIVAEEKDGAFSVRATASLSLAALGVPEIKGPLGAFKVSDDVAVSAVVALTAT
jgi:hypothetical protein